MFDMLFCHIQHQTIHTHMLFCHIQHQAIHTHTHVTMVLKDMLFVPSITKNLLSISKLTSDNPLFVEIFGKICYVKDMKEQVLLEDLAEKGLYKLALKSNHLSSLPVLLFMSSILASSIAFHLSQLNKPVSMLPFLNMSYTFQNCNAFAKAYFHYISNNSTQDVSNSLIYAWWR